MIVVILFVCKVVIKLERQTSYGYVKDKKMCLFLMARCNELNMIGFLLSFNCGRSVVFSVYIGFMHQLNSSTRYN